MAAERSAARRSHSRAPLHEPDRSGSTLQGAKAPEHAKAWTPNVAIRFLDREQVRQEQGSLHGPLGGASVLASRPEHARAPARGHARPTCRFMVPMRDCRIVEAFPEPVRAAPATCLPHRPFLAIFEFFFGGQLLSSDSSKLLSLRRLGFEVVHERGVLLAPQPGLQRVHHLRGILGQESVYGQVKAGKDAAAHDAIG